MIDIGHIHSENPLLLKNTLADTDSGELEYDIVLFILL